MLPDTIFYSETGGKSAPFYLTLAGIKSAFKTTWGARTEWRYKNKPRVYRSEVHWQEIDLETGKDLYRTPDKAVPTHVRVFHPDLVVGPNPIEIHDLAHAHDPVDHVHGEYP